MEYPFIMIFGYVSPVPELAPMVNGGGIVSMLHVAAIVCLSASFSGIFQGTGLLDGIHGKLETFARRFGNYPATLLSAIITSLISCSQTLAVILTSQLCGTLNKDKEQFAEDLEDTAIVIPAVIPWSIACAIVLAAHQRRPRIHSLCLLPVPAAALEADSYDLFAPQQKQVKNIRNFLHHRISLVLQ